MKQISGAIESTVRFNNHDGDESRQQCFEGDIQKSLITSSTVTGSHLQSITIANNERF